MSDIKDTKRLQITENRSPLAFSTEGGGGWKVWDRYLLVDGKKAFHIGNICGTCSFFFERLGGAVKSVNPADVVQQLTEGLKSVSDPALDSVRQIVPSGEYFVSLHEISPRLVAPGEPDDYFRTEQISLWGVESFWGLPHNPHTEYYRLDNRMLDGQACLYEFLIPMFPHNWLKEATVRQMKELVEAGSQPTVLALSVLDVKQPANWTGDPAVTSHWCLAHYMIDGHHKTFAGSQSCKPITMVSFLAIAEGLSSDEQKMTVIDLLRKPNPRPEA